MMKQRILTGLLFVLLLGFASCSSCSQEKPKGAPTQTEFESHVTESDTLAVKEAVGKFFSALMRQDYYGAAGMLYTRNRPAGQDEPELLDNRQLEEKVAFFKMFPYEGYEIDYIKFHEVEENEVVCRVIFQRGKNGEPDAYTRFRFTPVFDNGEWRLILTESSKGERSIVDPSKADSMRTQYDQSRSAAKDKAAAQQP